MPESRFDAWVAERYDLLWPELFDPTLVESTVDFLAGWAGSGPALELGVGTGRIAQPLSQRGIRDRCLGCSGGCPTSADMNTAHARQHGPGERPTPS